MTKINISVGVEMPDKVRDEYKQKDLASKVRDYMEICESNADSEYHWKYLKYLYKKLRCYRRLSQENTQLMSELTDFMNKYAGQDSGEDQLDIRGEDIFKYSDKNGEG
jgi:hypothetical protein